MDEWLGELRIKKSFVQKVFALHLFSRSLGSFGNLLQDCPHYLRAPLPGQKVRAVKEHELASVLQHEKELLTRLEWNNVILGPVDHEQREVRLSQAVDPLRAHKVKPALFCPKQWVPRKEERGDRG